MPHRRRCTHNPPPIRPIPPGSRVNLRINEAYNQETWQPLGWTYFLHQLTDNSSRRIPVTSYVAPNLPDLIAYIVKVQNPANRYVIQDVHGDDLLLCPQCGWIFQGYITDRCFQCKSHILWNAGRDGFPPKEILSHPAASIVPPPVAAAALTG